VVAETLEVEMTDNRSILDTPMPGNDADAATIRVFLLELLATLWQEGEGFSGKRPFGNSGWQHAVYQALVAAGHVDGIIDDDGWLDAVDERTADRLIARALRDVLGHQEIPPAQQVASQGTEWCVWYGGAAAEDASGVHTFDSEEEAREALQWYRDGLGSGIASRTVYTTAWTDQP
jgi:hypothetical protein